MDISIINFIQQYFHNPVTDTLFPFITRLGDAGLIWILIGAIMLITRKYRRSGLVMLLAALLAYVAGDLIIKPLVARPRPFMDFPGTPLLISAPNGFSFPSGHSASSFAAAFCLWKTDKRFGIAGFILASLIAGIILGFLCGMFLCYVNKKVHFRPEISR